MRRITREELALCHGRDGAPAWFACHGRVYDATHSFHWQHGQHQVLHRAGADLTAELAAAPHGEELLARCPLIGTLADEEGV